jgi:neuromedin U receptor 2
MLSGLFLSMMALDRAIAILFPLRAKTLCTTSRAWKAVLGTTLIFCLLNINMFFTMKPNDSIQDDFSIWLVLDFPEPAWVEPLFLVYSVGSNVVLPVTLILTSNFIIIFSMRRAARGRSKMAAEGEGESRRASSAEKQLTQMTILVSVAYVSFTLPVRVFDAATNNIKIQQLSPYMQHLIYFAYIFFGEVFHLNFAVNFYLYILGGGKRFRKDAIDVYRHCCGCFCKGGFKNK